MAEALDLQILEEIAKRTPEGKEGDLIVGLLMYGFDLDVPVYKKTVLEGLRKRGAKIPEWLEKKLAE